MLSLTYSLLSIAIGTAELFAGGPGAVPGRTDLAVSAPGEAAPLPSFSAEARAVSNWRGEAVQDLAPAPLSVLAVALGAERPVITRCVKLNNYWCIKSARWNGEVGADDEGHTGFATAEHGADAAVRLLRRYYLEFDRKSALDIVRRWAPAECRLTGSSGPPAALALRGLGNTLRARWLAARRAKPVRTQLAAAGSTVPLPPRPPPRPVSAVPLRPLPRVAVPSIMAGVAALKPSAAATLSPRTPPRHQPTPAAVAAARAEPRQAARGMPSERNPIKPAAVSGSMVAAPVPPPRPEPIATATVLPPPRPAAVSCAPDELRIQNYARRIVEGLELAPSADLALFSPDGRPQPNLARVLLAMSAFELGYLRASAELIEEAIERVAPPAVPSNQPIGGPPGPEL